MVTRIMNAQTPRGVGNAVAPVVRRSRKIAGKAVRQVRDNVSSAVVVASASGHCATDLGIHSGSA